MIRIFKNHVPSETIAYFTAHLQEFIQAGIPLLKSLEMLRDEIRHPFFRGALEDILKRVKSGESFAASLKRYPQLFSPFYVSLVQAGEVSGKLEFVLDRLTVALEKENDLKGKVQQALVYPAFVFGLGMLTVIFLMIVIVPKISAIYSDFGGEFPWVTKLVLGASHCFLSFGWIVALALAAAVVFLVSRQKEIPMLKKSLDRSCLFLPWFGRLFSEAEIARFGRTLGMLLESGVPLLQAVGLARQTVSNEEIRKSLDGVETKLGEGKSLSEILKQRRFFPELAIHLIWVGESTGTMDVSLQRLGQAAEKRVDAQVKLLTTLLEPMIIIVVGAIVGVIIIGLLLPIFQMSLLVR